MNLLHAAMYERGSLQDLLLGLFESLSLDRLEIDFLHLSGPEFAGIPPAAACCALLRNNLCRAIAFDRESVPTTPSELFHGHPLVLQRGAFTAIKQEYELMLTSALNELKREHPTADREPLALFEISINSARPDDCPDDQEVLRRVAALNNLGYPVLITNYIENFRLSDYLFRYTSEPIRFVTGVGTLIQVLRDSYYTKVHGGLLESMGRFLAQGVKVYAFPMKQEEFLRQLKIYASDEEFCTGPSSGPVTAENISFRGPVRHLYSYLREMGSIVPLS